MDKLKETKDEYFLKGRMWLAKDSETYLGFGRVVLLERIKEFGSITKAAKSMDMSYRHAWDLVDSMNRMAPKPLVVGSVGGKGGGGAVVTPEGERAIEFFWLSYHRFRDFLDDMQKDFKQIFSSGEDEAGNNVTL